MATDALALDWAGEGMSEEPGQPAKRYSYAEAAEWFKATGKKYAPASAAQVQQHARKLGLHAVHEIRYIQQTGRSNHVVPRAVALLSEAQLQEILEDRKPKPAKPVLAVVAAGSPRGVEHDVQCLRDKLRDQQTEVEALRERIRRLEFKWSEAGF